MTAGGGCETAVTSRIRCGWAMHREYGALLYGRFPLNLKMAIYKRYVSSAILYGSEGWCLKKSTWELYEGQRYLW